MTRLTEEELSEVRDVLEDGVGVVFSDAALEELLPGPLVGEVVAWGAGDTSTREQLVDAVAQALIGRPVPRNGDRLTEEELQAFWDSIAAAAVTREWGEPVQRDQRPGHGVIARRWGDGRVRP